MSRLRRLLMKPEHEPHHVLLDKHSQQHKRVSLQLLVWLQSKLLRIFTNLNIVRLNYFKHEEAKYSKSNANSNYLNRYRELEKTNLADNHPQGVYNQDNNHRKPSCKSHTFHPEHPKSMMLQHATYS